MPKVSVIVPVFGVENYIERCVKTLFLQSLDDIEFLFIDDCSPDRSIEIVRKVLQNFPNRKSQVKFHRMEHNQGQAAVREWGIKHASGEYIIHCDPDDWIDLEMYKKMYEKAVEGDYDMVSCNYYEVRNGKLVPNQGTKNVDYSDTLSIISNTLQGNGLTSLCDKLFKKSLFDSSFVYPKDNMQEDAAMVIQLLCRCKLCSCISLYGYYYYFHENSITHKLDEQSFLKRFHQVQRNADIIFSCLTRYNYSQKLEKEIIAHKLNIRNHILNLVGDNKFLKLWRDTYPEINGMILNNSKVKLINKLYYILVTCGLLSIIINLKQTLKS